MGTMLSVRENMKASDLDKETQCWWVVGILYHTRCGDEQTAGSGYCRYHLSVMERSEQARRDYEKRKAQGRLSFRELRRKPF